MKHLGQATRDTFSVFDFSVFRFFGSIYRFFASVFRFFDLSLRDLSFSSFIDFCLIGTRCAAASSFYLVCNQCNALVPVFLGALGVCFVVCFNRWKLLKIDLVCFVVGNWLD